MDNIFLDSKRIPAPVGVNNESTNVDLTMPQDRSGRIGLQRLLNGFESFQVFYEYRGGRDWHHGLNAREAFGNPIVYNAAFYLDAMWGCCFVFLAQIARSYFMARKRSRNHI